LKTQVFISGAGPVGSFAGYLLAQQGIDVVVAEAAPECPVDLRASTFHPPSLEMLDQLGVIDLLFAEGLKAPIYQYRDRSTDEVFSFDLTELADMTPHPYRVQCEQWKLARHLSKLLDEHANARLLFSNRVVHFTQDDRQVKIAVETPYGIDHYEADYLIAADGASSIVRKWLGVEFDGFTYPERFLTLSTTLPLEDYFKDLSYVNYVSDPDEWLVMLRVPSVWRVLVPARDVESDAALLSDEKKDEVFARLVGPDINVRTEHRTIYRVHQRVANTYRVGRVLLAGDAAHLNNPLGGMGMNSGLHDAWDAGHKLISVLRDGASDDVLDLYDRQRRTVMHRYVQAQSIANKEIMEQRDPQLQEKQREQMRALFANDAERRDFLLRQSLYTSLADAAAIA
jgi:3-(3-hydroxy-phenyl)propionate hydroxylase